MNIETITSFDFDYYQKIGQHCVDSWLEYWPRSLKLTCYLEGFSMDPHPRITCVPFTELSSDYWKFITRHKGSVVRFSKKAWSVIHAMEHSQADWIVWLDADVITKQPVTLDLLSQLLPKNVLATYMGVTYTTDREGRAGSWLVPETGFFAVNRLHPQFESFRQHYHMRYQQNNFDGLRRRYDNDVFGSAIRATAAEYNDLAAGLVKSYTTPMSRTILGDYLTHHKAKQSKIEFVQTLDQ